jgi:gas vesicle protein
MLGLLVGAVIGGAAVWFWRDRLAEKLDEKTRTLRVKAADTLETMEKQTDVLLDKAKPRIVRTLRAGQEAIRPAESTPPGGDAGATGNRAI